VDTTTEAYAKCFRIEGDVRVVAGAIDGSAKKARTYKGDVSKKPKGC